MFRSVASGGPIGLMGTRRERRAAGPHTRAMNHGPTSSRSIDEIAPGVRRPPWVDPRSDSNLSDQHDRKLRRPMTGAAIRADEVSGRDRSANGVRTRLCRHIVCAVHCRHVSNRDAAAAVGGDYARPSLEYRSRAALGDPVQHSDVRCDAQSLTQDRDSLHKRDLGRLPHTGTGG